MVVIFVATLAMVLETVTELLPYITEKAWAWVEMICVTLFTIELCIKLVRTTTDHAARTHTHTHTPRARAHTRARARARAAHTAHAHAAPPHARPSTHPAPPPCPPQFVQPVKKLPNFFMSPMNWVDVVAILPFYLTLVTDIGLPIECATGFLTVFQVRTR